MNPARMKLDVEVWYDRANKSVHIEIGGAENFHTTVDDQPASNRRHESLFYHLKRLLEESGLMEGEGPETDRAPFVIDHVEGPVATIEYNRKTFSVPRELLPEGAKEGDLVDLNIALLPDATRKAKKEIRGLMDEVFKEE